MCQCVPWRVTLGVIKCANVCPACAPCVACRFGGEVVAPEEGDTGRHGQEPAPGQEEAAQGHAPDPARRHRHVHQLSRRHRRPASARHGAGGHQATGLSHLSLSHSRRHEAAGLHVMLVMLFLFVTLVFFCDQYFFPFIDAY